ncbi:ras-related and estrogen-regulated growth inhibitor-like isoform X2 [Rhopilema esculentum]|eukprot:gene12253-2889_t
MVRFLTRRFIGEYDATESTHSRHIIIGNSTLVVEIKDTAGGNPISKRDEEISSSDAFIFVYSVTSNESFREVTKLIETVKNSSALSIVIGNKKDLHHLREVGLDEGRNFAEKYGCLFYEISVAEGYHETFRVFNELLRHIIMKKASDEGLSGKKKGNSSFSSILKGIDKAKQAR